MCLLRANFISYLDFTKVYILTTIVFLIVLNCHRSKRVCQKASNRWFKSHRVPISRECRQSTHELIFIACLRVGRKNGEKHFVLEAGLEARSSGYRSCLWTNKWWARVSFYLEKLNLEFKTCKCHRCRRRRPSRRRPRSV
jgi:hypothetical protein